jgi:hypothetical protein
MPWRPGIDGEPKANGAKVRASRVRFRLNRRYHCIWAVPSHTDNINVSAWTVESTMGGNPRTLPELRLFLEVSSGFGSETQPAGGARTDELSELCESRA